MAQRGPLVTAVVVVGGLIGLMTANASGGLVTAALARGGAELVAYLPGLWAVVFGLGMISARPYLPKGVGLVGLGLPSGGLWRVHTHSEWHRLRERLNGQLQRHHTCNDVR